MSVHRQSLTSTQALVGLIAVAAAYSVFYQLNAWLFSLVRVSDFISWVFLPAAIRMLSVMLLGWIGVAGLFVGSLAQLGPTLASDPLEALTLATLSSLPCLLAARLLQRALGVGHDLAGMTARQLILFGLAAGLANSVAHTLYFAARSASLEPLAGFIPMWVGDTVGTLLVLYLGAWLLARWPGTAPRR